MIDRRYGIKYRIDVGNFLAEDAGGKEGLTDALILISMLYPEDGSLSVALVSADGRNVVDEEFPSLPSIDIFKAWSLMANNLMESEDLPPLHRAICQHAFETIRTVILSEGNRNN